jgi:hypothetical protein
MSVRITVRLLPSSTTTRVLVTDCTDEVLKARLPAPSQMHRLATKTMLEAVALFCGGASSPAQGPGAHTQTAARTNVVETAPFILSLAGVPPG